MTILVTSSQLQEIKFFFVPGIRTCFLRVKFQPLLLDYIKKIVSGRNFFSNEFLHSKMCLTLFYWRELYICQHVSRFSPFSWICWVQVSAQSVYACAHMFMFIKLFGCAKANGQHLSKAGRGCIGYTKKYKAWEAPLIKKQ